MYQPFWDFRYWRTDSELRKAYMEKFAKHGITAMILLQQTEVEPFTSLRSFLKLAEEMKVDVWLRTNRVTPKKGIPGLNNGTLDFALDYNIQSQVVNYLFSLGKLSEEFSCIKGIVIGGEEIVGAHITEEEFNRWSFVFQLDNGYIPEYNLDKNEIDLIIEKKEFFDWVQKKNNDWWESLWKILDFRFPDIDFLIWPSTAALGESSLSSWPRPAYWDLYDLIVKRRTSFSVILASYNVFHKNDVSATAAQACYLRNATEGTIWSTNIYMLQQSHITDGTSIPPSLEQMVSHVVEARRYGIDGIGYWAYDIPTGRDVYSVDINRWESIFEAIESGRSIIQTFDTPKTYVRKPRYDYFLGNRDYSSFDTFAQLHKLNLSPTFLLDEKNKYFNI